MLQRSASPTNLPVLAISNARARAVSQKGPTIDVAALPAGSQHHISQSHSDLFPLLKQAADDNIHYVLIEGGDGTVRSVMTALLNAYDDNQPLPNVSILPCGTTNQIARNLGLKNFKDMKTILSGRLSEIEVPLVQIEKRKSSLRNERLFGFLFSSGALPHVSKFAQEKLNKKGVGGGTAVVGAVFKAVTGNRSDLMPPSKHKMRGRIQDQTVLKHKGKALGTVITTLPTLMLGLDPFWGEESAPLRLTWAEADSQKLGRNVASLWMGRKHSREHDGFHSHNVDRLNLRTKAPIVLDGDFLDLQGEKLKLSASRTVRFWLAAS